MTTYHCTERDCETTFQTERARFCPCCGSAMIRHALDRETRELEERRREGSFQLIPIYALGA